MKILINVITKEEKLREWFQEYRAAVQEIVGSSPGWIKTQDLEVHVTEENKLPLVCSFISLQNLMVRCSSLL